MLGASLSETTMRPNPARQVPGMLERMIVPGQPLVLPGRRGYRGVAGGAPVSLQLGSAADQT